MDWSGLDRSDSEQELILCKVRVGSSLFEQRIMILEEKTRVMKITQNNHLYPKS